MLVDSFYESSIHLDSWPEKRYGKLSCAISKKEARTILDQPFTYLGKGRQFFVFASSDGRYVLKFIKCQRVNVSSFYKNVPLPRAIESMRRSRLQEKQAKIDMIFASIDISATYFKEHTGVVFAHITKDKEIKKQVSITDKLGIIHTIDMDKVPFVIQKRAMPVGDTFDQLLDNQDYKGASMRFSQLVALMNADIAAKVYDIDSGLIERDNLGFLADQAIHVDIGTLMRVNELQTKAYFERLDPLLEWFETVDPDFAASCQDLIRDKAEVS